MFSRLSQSGATQKWFEEHFLSQSGLCAICGAELALTGRDTHVDHDHETGKVRGILCFRCNLGLGYFRDNCDFLTSAIHYLKETTGGENEKAKN